MNLKDCADAVFLWVKGQDITGADMECRTPYNDIKEQNADITGIEREKITLQHFA